MNVVTRATTLTASETAMRPPDLSGAVAAHRVPRAREVPSRLSLSIYSDLNAVESEWRSFEQQADCTAFQTFDWLSAWQRHIGERTRVRPAVAVGRFENGATAFLLPLCVAPK